MEESVDIKVSMLQRRITHVFLLDAVDDLLDHSRRAKQQFETLATHILDQHLHVG